MHPRNRTIALFTLAAGLVALPIFFSLQHPVTPIATQPPRENPPKTAETHGRKIQVALLLDTSSSMDGLIEQAKTQLWRIVNELGSARKNGERPVLEIALYEYGHSALSAANGFIRQVLPLTTDLDRVSEELFRLSTNGGEEYCGAVIETATRQLEWSASHEDMKLIFIAGNEPFTQGHVDYRRAVREAIGKGITVNTIFCGPANEGIATGWKDGAMLADGRYLSIDQDTQVAYVAAPQDDEITRLGAELNSTYIPYGADGASSYARQSAQDANASGSILGTMLSRSVSKASANYSNPSWDLVDAVRDGKVDLEKAAEGEHLPEAMRKMNPAERKAYVEAQAKERGRIQARIAELNVERNTFVAMKMKEAGDSKNNTLDQAMIGAVRDEASKNGYKFE